MTAVIQGAKIQEISTRSVDELIKAMGMSGVSKSQVSGLCSWWESSPASAPSSAWSAL